MSYRIKVIFVCLLSFCNISLFAQGRVRLQTTLDKGSIVYLRIKNDSPYMPKLRGLKLLDKWQNNQSLPYEVQEQSIQIEGRLLLLDLANLTLTELDVKEARSLKDLSCSKNKLRNLDLGSNKQLEKLDCAINEIAELNLSQNKELTYLNIYANKLKDLDLSSNDRLRQLYCGANELQSLSLDRQKALSLLNCGSNQLKTLELNPCPQLEELYCGNNQLVRVAIPVNISPKALFLNQNKLKLIALGSPKQLERLWSFGNDLDKQEIKKLVGFLPNNPNERGDFRLALKGQEGLVSEEILDELKNKGWKAIQTASDTWSDLAYYSSTRETALQAFTQANSLKIYPNPLKGARLSIEGAEPFALVRLYTMQGQLVLTKQLDGQGSLLLDLDGLNLSGYYLLQLATVSQLICIEP